MVLNEGQDLGAKDLDAHPADVEVVVDSAPEVQEEGEKVATPPVPLVGPEAAAVGSALPAPTPRAQEAVPDAEILQKERFDGFLCPL